VPLRRHDHWTDETAWAHWENQILRRETRDHFAAGRIGQAIGVPSLWWVNDVLSADFCSWLVRRVFARQARRRATR
jgi:hypothetical protein